MVFNFLSSIKNKIVAFPRCAEILAFSSALAFSVQAYVYSHTGPVTMDEGTYLTKGLFFVKGFYFPFQDYGPLTNKMPLSYLIPGAVQAIFGPGIRTGRYLSAVCGLLLMLALWIVTLRMAGKWWAVGLLWAFAINPANISYYSTAITQGITACMLAWVFVLILGENRPLWQIISGSILSCLIILTRQNMFPVVPLVLAYIFWQHGRRTGWFALLGTVVIAGIIHAIYYPGIFYLWLDMIPRKFFPFLSTLKNSLGPNTATTTTWDPNFSLQSKLFVFWEGIRFNFVSLLGAVITWVLWNRHKNWASEAKFKGAVFLSILLTVLIAIHLYAGLFQDYCLYCYSGYLAFFSHTGLLLLAVSFSSLVRKPGFLRQFLVFAIVLVGITGIAYGSYQELDNLILNIPVPRIHGLQILPGTTEIWRLLSNKFSWSFASLQQTLPTVAGFLLAIFILAFSVIYFYKHKKKGNLVQPGLLAFSIFFIMGAALSPTAVFGGGKHPMSCGWDVISSHEAVGSHLAQLIPPGSLVYWQNDLSPLPLLYIPGVRVFPAQLNHWYTYLEGGDPDQLEKKGFWNAALALKWKQEADFVLLADKYVNTWYKDTAISSLYDEMTPAPNTVPCRDRSIIHVFERLK